MSFQVVLRFILLAVISLSPVWWAEVQLKPVSDGRSEVGETDQVLFNALEASNDAQFMSLTTPDFYLFDGGTRFSTQGGSFTLQSPARFWEVVQLEVSEPDVHVVGNTAWVVSVSKGRITDSSGTKEQEWLESASLEKQATSWKIAFMHSTRVPKPMQNANDNKE